MLSVRTLMRCCYVRVATDADGYNRSPKEEVEFDECAKEEEEPDSSPKDEKEIDGIPKEEEELNVSLKDEEIVPQEEAPLEASVEVEIGTETTPADLEPVVEDEKPKKKKKTFLKKKGKKEKKGTEVLPETPTETPAETNSELPEVFVDPPAETDTAEPSPETEIEEVGHAESISKLEEVTAVASVEVGGVDEEPAQTLETKEEETLLGEGLTEDAGLQTTLVDGAAVVEAEKPKKKRKLSLKKLKKKRKKSSTASVGSELTIPGFPSELPESAGEESALEETIEEDTSDIPGEVAVAIDVEAGEEDKPKKKGKLSLKKLGKKKKGSASVTEAAETPAENVSELPENTEAATEDPNAEVSTEEPTPEGISEEPPPEGSTEGPLPEIDVEEPPAEDVPEDAVEETGYQGEFGINAILGLSMMIKKEKKKKKLVGAINAIQDLGKGPEYISFHVNILPQGKPIAKTHWEPASRATFAFLFMLKLGKVKPPPNKKSLVSVRLYGRQKLKGIGKGKCYAECTIPWLDVKDAGGPLKLDQKLHKVGGEEEEDAEEEGKEVTEEGVDPSPEDVALKE